MIPKPTWTVAVNCAATGCMGVAVRILELSPWRIVVFCLALAVVMLMCMIQGYHKKDNP